MIVRLEAACNNNCRVCTGRLPPGTIISSSLPEGSASCQGTETNERTQGWCPETGPGAVTVLRGGEPSMASDLLSLLREIGPVVVHSNGRRFAYEHFTRPLIPFLHRFVVSVHGPRADLHDWFTRTPGSFDETMAALAHLRSVGVPVTLRVPVGRHNLTELDRMPSLARDVGADRVRFLLLSHGLVERSAAGAGRELATDALAAGPFLAAAVRRCLEIGLTAEVAGLVPRDIPGLSRQEGEAILETESEPVFVQESGPVVSHMGRLDVGPESEAKAADADRAAPAWIDEPSGEIRAVVRTTCRNACQFCTTKILHEEAGRPWPQDRACDFLGGLFAAVVQRERGGQGPASRPLVRFVALEPAEHPDIDILVAAAARWFRGSVQIDSSGRRFADTGFAAHLIDCGLGKVDLALLGPRAEVHDRVAGSQGAFRDLARAITNLSGRVDLTGHIVVVQDNENVVVETLQWARRLGLDVTHVSFAAPASKDSRRYAEVAVFLPGWVSDTVRRGREGLDVLSLAAAEIPPCLLPRSLTAAWSHPPGRGGRLTHPEGFSLGTALKERGVCPLAQRCSLAAGCPGLFPQYLELFGTRGLRPVP